MENRDLDDAEANAFFSRLGSQSASAICRTWPGQHSGAQISDTEFKVIMGRLFGQPLTILKRILNKPIGRTNVRVDKNGRKLCAARLEGGSDTHRHDKVLHIVHGILRRDKVATSLEPETLFAHRIFGLVGSDVNIDRAMRGNVPDLLVEFSGTKQTIADLKVIGDVDSHARRKQNNRTTKQYHVNKRERQVPTDYARAANNLDRMMGHGDTTLANVADTPNDWYKDRNNWGSVRKRLDEFDLYGLVVGPHGEMSLGFEGFIDRAAELGASRLADEMAVDATTGPSATKIVAWHAKCRIGMTAQRAAVQHIIKRIAYPTIGGATRTRAQTDDAQYTKFGQEGPNAATDGNRDTHFASTTTAAPWLDAGMPDL